MNTIFARLTAEGTAAAETAVCADHLPQSVPADDTVTEPVECPGNDALACIVCGMTNDDDPYGGRPVGEAFNDPRVPCCGRDAADCDCPESDGDVDELAQRLADDDDPNYPLRWADMSETDRDRYRDLAREAMA